MQWLNYYVVHRVFYEHILDESHPFDNISHTSHVLSIPIQQMKRKKTIRDFQLTSQNIRWTVLLVALSALVGSVFRRSGSNNALKGFLKYNICIKPQSSPNIKADSWLFLYINQVNISKRKFDSIYQTTWTII
jgi:hypothetical protein